MRNGQQHSPETKEKLRQAKLRSWADADYRHQMSEAHRGKIVSPETREKLSAALRLRVRSPETFRKISEAQKGKKRGPLSDEVKALLRTRFTGLGNPFYGRCHSEGTRALLRQKLSGPSSPSYGRKRSLETRRKMSEAASGKSNHSYVDGLGGERAIDRMRARLRLDYRLWRETVFKRDNFTCRACGTRGGTLHADHIKSWRHFPEMRYEVGNGRTLCIACHRKTPSWGARARLTLL